MAEGYIKIEGGKRGYVYNYTDHLGNVWLSYTNKNGTAQVLQEKNYYPFGLQHKGYNDNINSLAQGDKYVYKGKGFTRMIIYSMKMEILLELVKMTNRIG